MQDFNLHIYNPPPPSIFEQTYLFDKYAVSTFLQAWTLCSNLKNSGVNFVLFECGCLWQLLQQKKAAFFFWNLSNVNLQWKTNILSVTFA